MRNLKSIFFVLLLIATACKSELKEDKFIGKWNVYSLIDSKNEIGGGKMFRNSLNGKRPVEDFDFEIQKSAKYENSYILSGFYGNQIPVFKADEYTLLAHNGEQELKIVYDEETQHLFLEFNNVTMEYEKVNSTVAESKKIVEPPKISMQKQELNLQDLQKLNENPSNTTIIEQKGYKYFRTVHTVGGDDKIYIGTSKDTISIFFQNITWSAGINGKSTFDKLKSEANKTLEYDQEYSEAEIGDEPEIPVYSEIYSYFDKNGTDHSAIIFFTDKSKTKVKKYSFYVGQSE